MTDEQRKKVPITVRDKRRTANEAASSSRASQRVDSVGSAAGGATAEASSEAASSASTDASLGLSVEELQRIKADLENDRKRMIREQSRALQYASRDLIKRMLPVVDNLRLAIEHGEGGPGVELALKELLDVLAAEGLEEIKVEKGEPFDPKVHHALSSHTDPSIETETVSEVTRRGYRFKDHILRSPEVVVAQPAGDQESIEG